MRTLLRFSILLLLVWNVSASVADAQVSWGGTFRQSDDDHRVWVTSDWNGFTSKWAEWEAAGLRMHDFEVVDTDGRLLYVGVFRKGAGGYAAWITDSWRSFTTQWAIFERDGLRMHDFEAYHEQGVLKYAGIFRAGTDARAATITPDWTLFSSEWDRFSRDGLRLHDFEVFEDRGVTTYAGIFRQGNDGHAASILASWPQFVQQWGTYEGQGLRMHDFDIYDVGNTRWYAGVFRQGGGAYRSWMGVDLESLLGRWAEWSGQGLRLHDIEAWPGAPCGSDCSDQLVMHTGSRYNYWVEGGGPLHCEGLPNSCVGSEGVTYRQPVREVGGTRYVRHSAVGIEHAIFTLPFDAAAGVTSMWGWLYSPGNYHHALDYARSDDATWRVRAAAPGRVIHVGYDSWSGGTIVVSHDVPGEQDRYRTIYMHLRNGANSDCSRAWNESIPSLSDATLTNYTQYLNESGCAQAVGSRSLQSAYWGTNGQTISGSLLGKQVDRGEFLAFAGSTGPGGCGCANGGGADGANTHLHIFFAHRDPTDDRWYLFDPYGIYGPSTCYPGPTETDLDACSRYPVAWLGGSPQYPSECPQELDLDQDGVGDDCDNCIAVANPSQFDSDQDGIGQACDSCPTVAGSNAADTDRDGVPDLCDNCPLLQNPDQIDVDGDGQGDVCDPDIDGDGCLNEDDQHPNESMIRVGTALEVCCTGGNDGIYRWEGEDSDGDGLKDCEDPDDDNDGICDDDVEVDGVCERGPDPCPVGGLGEVGCTLFQDCPCGPDVWFGCRFGGCFEFLTKLTSVINPDPTTEFVFENIQMASGRLYLGAPTGMDVGGALAQIQNFASGAGAGVGVGAGVEGGGRAFARLELWRKGNDGGAPRRVGVLAEFGRDDLDISAVIEGRFLVLTPSGDRRPRLKIESSWLAAAPPDYDFDDSDRDSIPDPFDNCPEASNRDQADRDGDGVGDACSAQGGAQRPGDCNQDGGLDISDGVCLLGHLFQGSPPALPCGDGSLNGSANRILADSNGDGGVDLSDGIHIFTFLFLGGSPPTLGTDCVTIEGCPSVCAR